MNIWDLENLFSDKTKNRILEEWRIKTIKDFENREDQENYLNENIGNSIIRVLKELEDLKE